MESKRVSPISIKLSSIQESATLKLNTLVLELERQGKQIFNLTTGEPDFPVPDFVKQAAIEAIRSNKSKYTPVPGILPLREKIALKTEKQTGLKFSPQEVVVTNGGKQAIMEALFALLNPGDEVVIGAPFWVSYPEMVRIAEGKPVIVSAGYSQQFTPTPEQFLNASSAKTKLWILNSPSNPTGAMYSEEGLRKFGQLLMSEPKLKNVWILCDDIYEHIVYPGHAFQSFLSVNPELRDRCVLINGLSKSFCMTGWRVGWSVAPLEVSKAIGIMQGQITSNVNSVAQYAALSALSFEGDVFAEMVSAYRNRKDKALDILNKSAKIKTFDPPGAFYLFLNISDALKPGESDLQFCERALQEIGVAMVPGGAFGDSSCVRISFAVADKTLEEGVARLVQWVEHRS